MPSLHRRGRIDCAASGFGSADMSELDDIKVYGETDVGWCALTLPNETVDDGGRPFVRDKGFSAADPRAPKRRAYDDPEVCALREYLRAHNGIHGLEMPEPHEIDRAAQIFRSEERRVG